MDIEKADIQSLLYPATAEVYRGFGYSQVLAMSGYLVKPNEYIFCGDINGTLAPNEATERVPIKPSETKANILLLVMRCHKPTHPLYRIA